MKASKLILALQALIDSEGDKEVQLMDYEYSLTLKINNINVEPSYRMMKPKPYESETGSRRAKGKDVIVLHSI